LLNAEESGIQLVVRLLCLVDRDQRHIHQLEFE